MEALGEKYFSSATLKRMTPFLAAILISALPWGWLLSHSVRDVWSSPHWPQIGSYLEWARLLTIMGTVWSALIVRRGFLVILIILIACFQTVATQGALMTLSRPSNYLQSTAR